eukprot:TRINITY_DN7226_c0_g1_i1.p1 TRINITY_DN7226_c0_g1~~TRINITY_DN7226_c0_g1_i1.p1  ORF type:complete len:608 (-),score=124.62 TRINITY_DN7226_c0_g1_i1:239-2062(-)
MLSQDDRLETIPTNEDQRDGSEVIVIDEDHEGGAHIIKDIDADHSTGLEGIQARIREMRGEASGVLKLVLPAVGTNVFLILLPTIDQMMVGQLGKDELAAAALGNAWFNLVWYFVVGVATLLDTLGSQAHGLGRKELVAYHTRRAMAAILLLCIPLCILVALSEPILRDVLGQDPDLSERTGRFCLPLLPGVPFLAVALILQKHLQTQGIMSPALYAGLVANIFNALANYILIYALGWGLTGAPWATSLTRGCQAIALGLASHRQDPGLFPALVKDIQYWTSSIFSLQCSSHMEQTDVVSPDMDDSEHTTKSDSKAHTKKSHSVQKRQSSGLGNGDEGIDGDIRLTWESVKRFLQRGAAGGAMVALEAWCFQITTILAGLLDDTIALDAHVVIFTVSAFTFIAFPFGVSIAASVRVGHLLGAGAPRRARAAAYAAIILGTGSMVLTAIGIYVGRNVIPLAFTDSGEVADAAAEIAPIAALYQILDGFQGVAAGVFRGMGRQRTVALLNLIGFWIVGTPVGAMLTFIADVGVTGLWWGLCIGLGVLSVAFAIALARTDWPAAAANAVVLISSDSTPSQNQDNLSASKAQRGTQRSIPMTHLSQNSSTH